MSDVKYLLLELLLLFWMKLWGMLKLGWLAAPCCWVTSVVSDSVWPHRQQPTRLLHPWDFPGKSAGVGCHCLLLLLPRANIHVMILTLVLHSFIEEIQMCVPGKCQHCVLCKYTHFLYFTCKRETRFALWGCREDETITQVQHLEQGKHLRCRSGQGPHFAKTLEPCGFSRVAAGF